MYIVFLCNLLICCKVNACSSSVHLIKNYLLDHLTLIRFSGLNVLLLFSSLQPRFKENFIHSAAMVQVILKMSRKLKSTNLSTSLWGGCRECTWYINWRLLHKVKCNFLKIKLLAVNASSKKNLQDILKIAWKVFCELNAISTNNYQTTFWIPSFHSAFV